MRSLAVLSLHTSPLAQPGTGDSGGMNVYVRELVSALAQAGVDCRVYVRRWRDDLPDEVAVEPGFRVVHVERRPARPAQGGAAGVVDDWTEGVLDHIAATGGIDAIHANYWLSGLAGHAIKHRLDLPLVSTFHTLARVKAETGDPEPQRRIDAESEVIACSDAILASCSAEAAQLERFYGARPERIEIVPPGVDHAFFSPGDQRGARTALDLASADRPVLLFVGRIQPLKGLDVAVAALAALPPPGRRARGRSAGPSGPSTATSSWPGSTSWPATLGRRATGSATCRPSRTTCCPPTTGPPTSASCRAGRSPSASSPSRPPPAAPRSWPPRWAGSPPSSRTAAPACSIEGPRPGRLRRRASPACSADPAARPRDGRGRRRPCPRLHVVDRGGPPAPRLRRPHPAPTGRLRLRRAEIGAPGSA